MADSCLSVIVKQAMENATHKAKATELELILDRFERR